MSSIAFTKSSIFAGAIALILASTGFADANNYCHLYNPAGVEIGVVQDTYLPLSLIGRFNPNIDAYDTQGAFEFTNGGGRVHGRAMVLGSTKYITSIGTVDSTGQMFDYPLGGRYHYLGRVNDNEGQVLNANNQIVATFSGCKALSALQRTKLVGAASMVLLLWDYRVHQKGDWWSEINPAFL
jgi:hypothetical protein